jgi:hypothetical protein
MAKVVITGIARDCAAHLPAVLANAERLASTFEEAAFAFVENDSRDATKHLLSSWGSRQRNFTLFNLDGLGQMPVRTLRTEYARNVYLEYVRSDPTLAQFDTLCVMDMDDVGAYPIDLAQFAAAVDLLGSDGSHAGVFANQLGTYYDMWTLRHAQLCPGDIWFDVLERVLTHGQSDQEAFDQAFAPRILSFGSSSGPVEVDSAFGGLGIYRLDHVRRSQNPYLGSRVRVLRLRNGQRTVLRMQQCEHVHFNHGLRQLGGRLFIMPGLINGSNGGLSFPVSAFRSLVF